ncbi:hypothetical protein ACFWUZ_27105 [Streptomyces sp. NPDC058646]|uniref:hypothetical protein n=1 Tax=Streptomyces sp. NPDC058646 TaxID=3346574 RepID=UPI003646E64B
MPESSAPLRAVRAAMFAAVCVALGAVGHSSMPGSQIPFLGLLGAFGVTGGLAWLAAGRRRGPVGIALALLSVQGVLHLVFSGSQAARSPHTAPPVPAPASVPEPVYGHGHGHGDAHHHVPGADMGALPAPPPDPAGTADVAGLHDAAGLHDVAGLHDAAGMADVAGMAGHGGVGMIAAHVLAGLFCALWLARGEAALFRLTAVLGSAALLAARPLSRALALVAVRPAPPAAPAPAAGRPARDRPRRLRGAVHAHAVVRRGPPGRCPHHRATAPGRTAFA